MRKDRRRNDKITIMDRERKPFNDLPNILYDSSKNNNDKTTEYISAISRRIKTAHYTEKDIRCKNEEKK